MSFLNSVEMGLGTWAWGKGAVWGYGDQYTDRDLKSTFEAAVESGIQIFDTAEVYGDGYSEILLGKFLRAQDREKIYIATKFAPFPWRICTSDLLKALRASLSRLGLKSVDLYQIHWTSPPRSIKAWMQPLAEAVKEGLVTEVGVSNFNRDQMLRAHEALAARGILLASNQMQLSLVRRKNDLNGLLEECKKTNIRLIAYSPLGMGMLSGKYSPENPPTGPRRLFYFGQLGRIQKLVGKLRALAMFHEKTVNQVALNWIICKGALPIPGAKNIQQVRENAGAMGWRLTDHQVAELDEASRFFKG